MTHSTLVIQSQRSPLPFTWLQSCLDSVENWAKLHGFDYHYIGDELFAPVPAWLMEKTKEQKVIATDIARLMQMRAKLDEGYQRVIWCDADFLIFNPAAFIPIDAPYALGREIWIQLNQHGKLKSFKKVHNAYLAFDQGNSFLDFYIDSAISLLQRADTQVPLQFVGPKLTALHNVIQCPVQENVGMLSLVIEALVTDSKRALTMMQSKQIQPLRAANLCSSLNERGK